MRGNELVKKTPFVIIALNHAILAIQQNQENPFIKLSRDLTHTKSNYLIAISCVPKIPS